MNYFSDFNHFAQRLSKAFMSLLSTVVPSFAVLISELQSDTGSNSRLVEYKLGLHKDFLKWSPSLCLLCITSGWQGGAVVRFKKKIPRSFPDLGGFSIETSVSHSQRHAGLICDSNCP